VIRNLLTLIIIVLVYYAFKTVLNSAFKAYHDEPDAPARLKGEEMVLDPECRTYVIKDRAVTRRLHGRPYSFCSEACAQRYEDKHRS
jgi:YHS domain-containing protein